MSFSLWPGFCTPDHVLPVASEVSNFLDMAAAALSGYFGCLLTAHPSGFAAETCLVRTRISEVVLESQALLMGIESRGQSSLLSRNRDRGSLSLQPFGEHWLSQVAQHSFRGR